MKTLDCKTKERDSQVTNKCKQIQTVHFNAKKSTTNLTHTYHNIINLLAA